MVNESILEDVKKYIGLTPEYKVFDPDILMHINSAFSVLTQVGLGNAIGFRITGDETWDEILRGEENLEFVKDYVYSKVRLGFDPPQNSFLLKAIEDRIKELEWRINVAVDRD